MASMMGGDFVEAYVLKNAYKEKLRRMEAAEEKKTRQQGSGSAERKASGSRGGSREGGLFGMMKKKVHPKAAASSEADRASS
ncbi:hypothetical protein SEVIR_1G209300v4 [Setaria viridis]|uniref:Uncharacterized protein n=1 Tax=Setaria viridis TaxID=4556 RepID=A0A4U6WFB7_SETVI|nr:uncharacterized protein LOC117858660 [Setaria viridis]TKW39889.1 hypothetical protein SEVIR_1G209300v2 [Setaria viridis]